MLPEIWLWLLLRASELAIVFWPGMRTSVDPFHWKVAWVDCICSLAFSTLVTRTVSRSRGMSRWAWIFFNSGLLGLLWTSSALLYQEFGEFVSAEVLLPLAEDPAGAPTYVLGYIKSGGWLLLGPAWAVFALTLHALNRATHSSPFHGSGLRTRLSQRVAIILPLVFLVVAMNGLRLHAKGAYLQMESSFFRALFEVHGMSKGRPLHHSPQRLQVRGTPQPSPHSILIILGESWGAEELRFFPTQSPTQKASIRHAMPDLEAWVHSQKDQLLQFPHAFSNSADTKVSVPSLMTGVSPDRPIQELHKAPFAWHWANAYGLKPIYITSQRYRWSGFFEFFRRDFPGEFFSAEDTRAPLVNDIGIDDSISAGRFDEILSSLPRNQRFFAVYNPNALHAPHQSESPLLEGVDTADKDRLGIAHLIADRAIRMVLDSLQKNNRLEETFVFFTGDHGTGTSERHGEARLFNQRDGVIRVPLMIRVPTSWKTKHPRMMATARTNARKPVANIDILPAILDILDEAQDGNSLRATNAETMTLLSGQSVFQPMDATARTLVSLVPVRRKAGTRFGAFSLIRDNWRLVYSSWNGFDLIDVNQTPLKPGSLWSDPEHEEVRHSLLQEVFLRPELKRILSKGNPAFLNDPEVVRARASED